MRIPVISMDIIDISVRNPVKVSGAETYTTYEISVQTTNIAFSLQSSLTRRRFSEFCWLRKKLGDHHPQIKPPALPKKGFFSERFDPEFVAIRMKNLENFLTRCFEERLYFSDSSLHLFVQSSLTCDQIDDYLKGSLSQEEVIQARARCQGSVRHGFKSQDIQLNDTHPCVANIARTDLRTMSTEPQNIAASRQLWGDLGETTASSSESVSDSLEKDMFLSCAVGPGSIQ